MSAEQSNSLAEPAHESAILDLAEVPAIFYTDAPHDQSEVSKGITGFGGEEINAGLYFVHNQPRSTYLSEYENMYENQWSETAMKTLSTYTRVKFNRKHTADSNSPDLIWASKVSYIDALVLCPSEMGLKAIIPHPNPGPGYTLQLDFSHRGSSFNAKYSELGFNPTGSMMRIGYCSNEQVWLALRPRSQDDKPVHSTRKPKTTKKYKDTRMSTSIQHMMIMFIAYIMHEAAIVDVFVAEGCEYPPDIKNFDSVKESCNLLLPDSVCITHYRPTNGNVFCAPNVPIAGITAIGQIRIFGHVTGLSDMSLDIGITTHPSGRRELRLADVKKLDNDIEAQYRKWLANAPPEWKKEIGKRIPIILSARWGQNYPIQLHSSTGLTDAQDNWVGGRDLTKIRYVTVALATDISAVPKRKDLEPRLIAPEDVWELANGHVFHTPDIETRDELTFEDLEALPYIDDEDGSEICVYDDQGYRIARVHFEPDGADWGLLADLSTLPDFFAHRTPTDIPDDELTPDDIRAMEGEGPSPKLSFYPQAFLGNVGHYQANTLPAAFSGILDSINSALGDKLWSRRPASFHRHIPDLSHKYGPSFSLDFDSMQQSDSDSDDEDDSDNQEDEDDVLIPDEDEESLHSRCRPVTGRSSQGYNEVAHRFRYRAATHDAQNGDVTATGAGIFASLAADKTKARTHKARLGITMPFDRFKAKLSSPHLNRAWRAENVAIFHRIIRLLCRVWLHPSLLNQLKLSLYVINPAVYPAMYLWTSWPLASALRTASYQFSTDLDAVLGAMQGPSDTIPPPAHLIYLLELISMFERTLNYGQTGNARALSKTSMSSFYLAHSVLYGALPMWSKLISLGENNRFETIVRVRESKWPLGGDDNLTPLSSAAAAISFHYNDLFAQVSRIFSILHPLPLVRNPRYYDHCLSGGQRMSPVTVRLLMSSKCPIRWYMSIGHFGAMKRMVYYNAMLLVYTPECPIACTLAIGYMSHYIVYTIRFQYLAYFLIHHTAFHVNCRPALLGNDSESKTVGTILSVLDVVVKRLVYDLLSFVKRSFARILAELQSRASSIVEKRDCAERANAFTQWSKAENPFSHADQNVDNIILILFGMANASKGFPLAAEANISYQTLASRLITFAKATPGQKIQLLPPLQSKSGFIIVLQLAYRYISPLASTVSQRADLTTDALLTSYLGRILKDYRIHFLPWCSDPVPKRSGPQSRALTVTTWINVTAHHQGLHDDTQSLVHSRHAGVRKVAQEYMRRRTDTPWTALALPLKSLPAISTRTVPPGDLAFASFKAGTALSNAGLIQEHHDWVFSHIRLSSKSHKAAVIAGWLVTKLCPDIFINPDPKWPAAASLEKITKSLQDRPFVHKSGRASTAPGPIFCAFVAQVIGMQEPTSPLGKAFASTRSLPEAWRNKYSQKGIHYSLMVRFGVATLSSFPNSNGRPNDNSLKLLSAQELALKVDRFDGTIKNGGPHAEFHAATIFCGPHIAREIGKRGAFSVPSNGVPHHPISANHSDVVFSSDVDEMPGFEVEDEGEGEGDNDNDDELLSPPRKRARRS
ncbi:hypothetical protein BDW22DRAFT_1346333 [Trametopsis cervina]|nr:hypothetical protein BDW22DRAFT_1346333 [Trametopsis cervina]